jgi:hypothetical protein
VLWFGRLTASRLTPSAGERRLRRREPSVIEETLLAEVLALRTILLNLHFTVAKGEAITAEGMQAIIERADRDKAKKATERLAAGAKISESGVK